eukprot:2435769-Rhodomonas_salina.1
MYGKGYHQNRVALPLLLLVLLLASSTNTRKSNQLAWFGHCCVSLNLSGKGTGTCAHKCSGPVLIPIRFKAGNQVSKNFRVSTAIAARPGAAASAEAEKGAVVAEWTAYRRRADHPPAGELLRLPKPEAGFVLYH